MSEEKGCKIDLAINKRDCGPGNKYRTLDDIGVEVYKQIEDLGRAENIKGAIDEWITAKPALIPVIVSCFGDNINGVTKKNDMALLVRIKQNKLTEEDKSVIKAVKTALVNIVQEIKDAGEKSPAPDPVEKSTVGNNTEEENDDPDSKYDNTNLYYFLKDDSDYFFEGSQLLERQLKIKFRQDFIRSFLYITQVSTNKKKVVKNNEDLNESLREYRASLYKILEDYIEKKDPYFKEKKKKENLKVWNENNGSADVDYVDFLFRAFMSLAKGTNSISKILATEWLNFTGRKGTGSSDTLDAVNAYLILRHFDELVRDEMKDTVNIDRTYWNVETRKYQYGGKGTKIPFIKYTIGAKNQNTVKNWNIGEFRDALKEMSNLQQLVCEIIPIVDKNDAEIQSFTTISAVGQAWGNLRNALLRIPSDTNIVFFKDLKKAIMQVLDNPNQGIHKTLELLFNAKSKKDIEALTQGNELTLFQIDLLRGIYRTIFSEKHNSSLTYIEKDSDILGKYLLQDLITSALLEITPANYLESKVNYTGTTTEYARKSSTITKNIYDYRESINMEYDSMGTQRLKLRIFEKGDEFNPIVDIKKGDDIDSTSMIIDIAGEKYRIVSKNSAGKVSSFIGDKTFSSFTIERVRDLSDGEKDRLVDLIFGEEPKTLEDVDNKKTLRGILNNSNWRSSSEIFDHIISIVTLRYKNKLIEQKDQSEIKWLLGDFDLGKSDWGAQFQGFVVGSKTPKAGSYDEFRLGLLQFIDKFLHLRVSKREGIEALALATQTVDRFTIVPVLKSAFKAAYIAAWNYEQKKEEEKGVSFDSFAARTIGGYYDLKNSYNGVFLNIAGHRSLKVIHNEDWIDSFISAQATLVGEDVAATSNDINKNKRANFRSTSLAAEFKYYITEQSENQDAAMVGGLFQKNPSLLLDMGYDSSMQSLNMDKITTKQATLPELIYNGIVHNFWNSFANGNKFQIQPTVYSDKTSICVFSISGEGEITINYKDGREPVKKKLIDLTPDEAETLYANTIGLYFDKQFKAVIQDYNRLFTDSSVFAVVRKKISNDENLNDAEKAALYTTLQKAYDSAGEYHLSDEIIQQILGVLTEGDMQNLISTYNANNTEQILIGREIHYRTGNNGKLVLNETLVHYGKFLFKENNLHDRFEKEKRNFLIQLLNNHMNFQYSSKANVSVWESVVVQLGINKEDYESKWVKNGRLILAKDENGNEIRYSRHLKGNFQLNPLLEKYYYIDNLLSSNLKYSLVGSEIPDPLKFKYFYTDDNAIQHYQIIDTIDKYDTEHSVPSTTRKKLQNATLSDLFYFMQKVGKGKQYEVLKKAYKELSEKVIAIGEGAQYKRNVILPATRIPLQVNSITGVTTKTKVAIIDDTMAKIFNYLGDRDVEEANNGSAVINPFQAILENRSLGAKEVGYNLKKPIWYHYDPRTGTSVLVKFASFTLSNAEMRVSGRSPISSRAMFKRMTNIRWSKHLSTNFNFTDQVYRRNAVNDNGNISHPLNMNDITSVLESGNQLFYKSEGRVYEIVGVEKIGNVYYTKEKEVGTTKVRLVANLYKNDSEIIKIRQSDKFKKLGEFEKYIEENYFPTEEGKERVYHSIDSLYEMWAAFGGENSVHLKGDEWADSENSTYAVVNVMNNVYEETEEDQHLQDDIKDDDNASANYRKLQNQGNYKQPLKELMIGYAANITAVKRGQFNVNSAEAWENPDYELQYIELDNRGLGVQQDPDHEADEAEVAEMTQVIASLDVGGEMHDIAKYAFQDLGKLIAHGFENEDGLIKRLLELAKEKGQDTNLKTIQSQFYDLLAREFIVSFKSHNTFDLSTSIQKRIEKNFQTNSSELHGLDKIKLPASDPNVFNSLVSAFVGKINSFAMKRRYTGEAAVMVPSYNKVQIFHFNEDGENITLTYQDIKNKAFRRNGINIYKTPQRTLKDGSVGYSLYGPDYEAYLKKEENQITLEFTEPYTTEFEKLQILAKIKRDIANDSLVHVNSYNGIEQDLELFEKMGFIRVSPEDTTNEDYYFIKKEISEKYLEDILIDACLLEEQNKDVYLISADKVQPTDRINILYGDDEKISLNLDDIDDYYDFKEYFCSDRLKNLFEKYKSTSFKLIYTRDQLEAFYLEAAEGGYDKSQESFENELCFDKFWGQYFDEKDGRGKRWKNIIKVSLLEDVKIQQDIINPTNLRPQRVYFQAEDGRYYNLYDLDPVKEAHYSERKSFFEKSFQKKKKDKKYNRDQEKIQDSMVALVEESNPVALINGKKIRIKPETLTNEAAEMLMSNVYASKFNQTIQTMYDMTKELPIAHTHIYTMPSEFTMVGNGKYKGLTFVDPRNDRRAKISYQKWREIVEPAYERTIKIEDNEIKVKDYAIYAESKKTKQKNYQIGISEDVSNIYGINEFGDIYDLSDDLKEPINDRSLVVRNGKVYRNTYFVQNLNIVKDKETHSVLYVNKKAIAKYNQDLKEIGAEDKAIQLNALVKKILDCDGYTYIQMNNFLNNEPKLHVVETLEELEFENDNSIYNRFIKLNASILRSLQAENTNFIEEYTTDKEYSYINSINILKKDYNKSLKYHYEISKLVMSARIPAQTLQSYMQMKCVGYIPTTSNQCMVSHWQTWLQGSDYELL